MYLEWRGLLALRHSWLSQRLPTPQPSAHTSSLDTARPGTPDRSTSHPAHEPTHRPPDESHTSASDPQSLQRRAVHPPEKQTSETTQATDTKGPHHSDA